MAEGSKKKIFSGSVSGILAKVVDAFIKLFTIPLLIGYYGEADYGLIVLAISLNAYLRLMDLGMNTGAIRYFSIWFANKEHGKVLQAAQSSVLVYGLIGITNGAILCALALWAEEIFVVAPEQAHILRWMLYTLAITAIFYWISYVTTQLLVASGQITWTNYGLIISSILNLGTAFLAIYFDLPLPMYFALYVVATLVILPFNFLKLKSLPVSALQAFIPKWNPVVFKEIFNYSLGIFAIGLFNYSADALRPVLLGIFSSRGIAVLTDYKIMNTIVMLVGAIGTVFLQVLLPIASQSFAAQDHVKMNRLVFDGTKFLTIFLSFLIFIIITSIESLLVVYVGEQYSDLSYWLSLWLLLMFYMHDFAISSLILSIGKTRQLIYSSAIAAVVSLLIMAFLIPTYEVGSAVIGFGIFIFVQILFNYLYFLPVVLKINAKKVFFRSFLPPVLVGLAAFSIITYCQKFLKTESGILPIVINSIGFTILFVALTLTILIKPRELRSLLNDTFKK